MCLILDNTNKYCPLDNSTIMEYLVQKPQGVISTKPNLPTTSSPDQQLCWVWLNELYIHVTPISKLCTDDTGCFHVRTHIGNQYIMIKYHFDANLILAEPFASRKDKHGILAFGNIMQRLLNNKLTIDLQILDNEGSADYKQAITEYWDANDQLVPPYTHVAMQLNAPFARSWPTFFPYSRVLLHISQEICGIFYSLKLN